MKLRQTSHPRPSRDHPNLRQARVALIGAGSIAPIHARMLGHLDSVDVVGIVDSRLERASKLASAFRIPSACTEIDQLLEHSAIDAAHVLVPPDSHAPVAQKLLSHGIRVLIEKPMAATSAECQGLIDALGPRGGRSLYVNHNFVLHPAFDSLAKMLRARRFGPALAISCIYAMPLRQLDTGEFHHWMFRRPVNLLLEQAIHPLSQIVDIAGPVEEIRVLPGTNVVRGNLVIPTSLSVLLRSRHHHARLHLHLGATFPCWQVCVLCSDAAIEADILRNTFLVHQRTQWLEPIDNVLRGRRLARALWRQDIGNLSDYALSMLGVGKKISPYLSSMRASIERFHAREPAEIPVVNTPEGAVALVRLCEEIAAVYPEPRLPAAATGARPHLQACKAVVFGGSGFIGTHIVKAFANKGITVRAVARNWLGRGITSESPLVSTQEGDVACEDDVMRLIEGATWVVNATGEQLGANWQECEESVRKKVAIFCDACLRAGVRRVVHLGSSAALFLGRPGVRVTGSSPVDPQLFERAVYARAKGLADELLSAAHAERGLPVCILRPAIVVGEGGTPFHSGVGLFVNGRHFLGWNKGNNPLPFVLASDVAEAVVAACFTDGLDGRAFNLAGDVRLTAREYVQELARALQRPLVYHPQHPGWLWLSEAGKWAIKWVSGRSAWRPSYRDLSSRAFLSWIDCEDAKRDLGWKPVSDRSAFLAEAFASHQPCGHELRGEA